MSKNINPNQKRQLKTQKRRGLARKYKQGNLSIETRIIKQVKRNVKQNKRIDVPALDYLTVMEESQKKIKDLLYFHYYLIFIQEMIDGNILQTYQLKYDVKKSSKIIRGLNQSIGLIPNLDEDIAHIEMASIAEDIFHLTTDIYNEILRTESIAKWVSNMIDRRGESLPPKQNGLPRSHAEITFEVLRITAINYMATKIFNIPMEESQRG